MIIFKQVLSELIVSFLVATLAIYSSASVAENTLSKTQIIKKEKLIQLVNKNKDHQQVINLSPSIKLNGYFSASAKGNATIRIENIFLRLFDQHDDGIVYPNSLLELELIDLNNDGINELILTGLVATTDDDDEISSTIHTTYIFQYSTKEEKFITLFSSGSTAPIL